MFQAARRYKKKFLTLLIFLLSPLRESFRSSDYAAYLLPVEYIVYIQHGCPCTVLAGFRGKSRGKKIDPSTYIPTEGNA